MVITAFLSRSHGLFNRGPGGPHCWVLVFSTASSHQLTDFLSSPELYNCLTYTFFLWASRISLNSTRPRSRLYPDIPRPDAPVIYTGAFPILTAWPGSICYKIIKPWIRFLVHITNKAIQIHLTLRRGVTYATPIRMKSHTETLTIRRMFMTATKYEHTGGKEQKSHIQSKTTIFTIEHK